MCMGMYIWGCMYADMCVQKQYEKKSKWQVWTCYREEITMHQWKIFWKLNRKYS